MFLKSVISVKADLFLLSSSVSTVTLHFEATVCHFLSRCCFSSPLSHLDFETSFMAAWPRPQPSFWILAQFTARWGSRSHPVTFLMSVKPEWNTSLSQLWSHKDASVTRFCSSYSLSRVNLLISSACEALKVSDSSSEPRINVCSVKTQKHFITYRLSWIKTIKFIVKNLHIYILMKENLCVCVKRCMHALTHACCSLLTLHNNPPAKCFSQFLLSFVFFSFCSH